MSASVRWLQGFATAVLFLGMLLPSTGCGKKDDKGGDPGKGGGGDTQAANHMKMIGLSFHTFWDSKGGKGPTKAEDLEPYLEKGNPAFTLLKEGKYDAAWNLKQQAAIKAGMDKVAVAWEKDVPTRGGYVALATGESKMMTADEFKALPKP
jgi:hypothetical protein